MKLIPKFVETIPEDIEEGIIYISMEYATAIHKCCSGCGQQVVTPFSPTDWNLTFDGKSVSLSPSIGNWSFPCQAHYWIKNNEIIWASRWTKEQIRHGIEADTQNKEQQYEQNKKSFKAIIEWIFRKIK